jgi:hypothetical protein
VSAEPRRKREVTRLEHEAARALELKARLIELAWHEHGEALVRALRRSGGMLDEARSAAIVDDVVFDGDGMVLDAYAERTALDPHDRARLLAWRGAPCGVFRIERAQGRVLSAANEIDGARYGIYLASGEARRRHRGVRRGAWIVARLLPLDTAWLASGTVQLVPAAERHVALALAAELAVARPDLVLRSPALAARARTLGRALDAAFVGHFRSRLVLGAAGELERALDGFLDRWHAERRQAAAAPGSDAFDGLVPVATRRLPRGGGLGLVSTPDEGIFLVPRVAELCAALEHPASALEPRRRHALAALLDDPDVPAAAVRVAADVDPDAATALFRGLLGDPGLDWARDADELLRLRKPARPEPIVVPLRAELAACLPRRPSATEAGFDTPVRRAEPALEAGERSS